MYEVAAFLLGWTPVLLSTRNSIAALEHLIRTSDANMILVDDRYRHLAQEMKDSLPDLLVIQMPYERRAGSELIPFVRPASTAQGTSKELDRPVVYIHTSGSTGFPKLIPITHQGLISGARSISGDLYVGDTVYGPLPLAHGLGAFLYIMWPLGSGVLPTFVSTKSPITRESVVRHLELLEPCIAFLAPAILEEIFLAGESGIRVLSRAKRVMYGGAPLRRSCGDALVSHGVSLITCYGMTEINSIGTMDFPSMNVREDWMYIRFHDNYNLHFLPVDDDPQVRELIVSPGRDASPAIMNHADPVGFVTNDLWSPHPTISGLWKHVGRRDSVIVLSNGEKTDTKQIENLLLKDPHISRVVVFGSGHFLNGVILEPAETGGTEFEFLNKIWPTVVHANEIVPKHSRLLREMVLVRSDVKPIVLTDKGSVKTNETLRLYSSEIEEAYSRLEIDSQAPVPVPKTLDHAHLLVFVKTVVLEALGRNINERSNLFDNGADSLHAIQIRSALMAIVRRTSTATDPVSSLLVYENPTIEDLTSFLLRRVSGNADTDAAEDRCLHISRLVDRFSSNFPRHVPVATTPHDPHMFSFLITGTTGSLGSHVLASLAQRSDVHKVYCFNRPADGLDPIQRQQNAFTIRGIDHTILNEAAAKIEIMYIDLSSPDLGLEGTVLERIRSDVTHIVHLAWQMNFNVTVDNFERTQIAGVRHLIDLALSSRRTCPPKFIFVSSIAAALGFQGDGPIPERAMDNPEVVKKESGYGQAKYVVERVIDNAARETGLAATVIRCGQLSGSSISGAWNMAEYIPILLLSSVESGVVPAQFPSIRWVPIDVAADVVVDLCVIDREGVSAPFLTTYWHVENVTETPWTEVVEWVMKHTNRVVRPIGTVEWIDMVKRAATRVGAEGVPIPAVKLVDFYDRFTGSEARTLDVTKTLEASMRLRELGSVVPFLSKYVDFILSHKHD